MSEVAPLSDHTRRLLESCGAATLANALLKRGFRNTFLLGLQAVAPGQGTLIGPAWTVRFIPAREDTDSMELYARDDSLHRRAIEECDPGAVLVLATGGDARASSMGDMMALRLKARGVAGAITDGGFRDVPGIGAAELPCYQVTASGPATPIWLHPVEFNTPVGFAGVAIYPGDIIVGNEEGIVAIPRHLVDEIAQECAGVGDYEVFVASHIRRGRSLFGLFPATPDSRREYDDWVAAGRPEI
ncbi:MAG TPA: ribonuclease activity regulator RraA [Paracoccus sp. (in: a-proteobacteria)]|uniref:RraA family protein n=1 Tax=Paracoccus sp. TaxID=267 RepID=UPI002CD97B44|nr:ribonuclease activity regulator RraA [Paracoccus sp. (in: a-proteobacteria)]HWL57450.1 ribonuclease activity regulator RraA [Paracoccus sp. (in: a-proteobacteria)]